MLWLKIGIGALGGVLSLLIVLYFSILHIKMHIEIKQLDFKLTVQIFLWRIRILNFKIPEVQLEKDPLEFVFEQESSLTQDQAVDLESDELASMFQQLKGMFALLKERKQIREMLHIENLTWESAVGCEEADWTAMTVGLLWTIKSFGLRMIQSIVDLQNPQLKVVPVFNKWYLETHFSCMISFRLGKAITQALWIRKQLKRRRLLHGRPSHSRTHEDSA